MGWFRRRELLDPQLVRAGQLVSLTEAKAALEQAERKIQEYQRWVKLEIEAVNARERETRTGSP